MSTAAPGDTFSPDQISAYFSRIFLPRSKYKDITKKTARSCEGFSYLAALQNYQLTHVPFENLSLHYSPHRTISLDKEELFEKIVTLKRGGYCMENNLLFATVLRTLGFEVVATGARVGGNGFDHQLSLVRLGEEVFMVDVGFGSQGPTRPLRLIHGEVSKWGATDAEMRLTYHKPDHSFVQGTWIYEHRNSPAHDWSQMYTFTMTEFTAKDFDVMNYSTSNRKSCFFTYKIICMKSILDEEAGDIIGALILEDQTLKKRIRDKTEILAEFSTEEERVTGLKKYFGFTLTEREKASIKGTVTSLT